MQIIVFIWLLMLVLLTFWQWMSITHYIQDTIIPTVGQLPIIPHKSPFAQLCCAVYILKLCILTQLLCKPPSVQLLTHLNLILLKFLLRCLLNSAVANDVDMLILMEAYSTMLSN